MSRKKPIPVRIKDIEANPDNVFTAKVIAQGNGAKISFYKKFIGREVYVIVK